MTLPEPLRPDFPLDIAHPFTRRMANEAGVTDNQLVRLTSDGLLRRPVKGAYVATQLPDTLDLRVEVLKLVVPAGCFVTDRTAGWLHVGEMMLAPNDHLAVPAASIFRPPDEGRLRNPLVRSGERAILPRDLMEIDGLPVTIPLRTALDLGRLERRDQAFACMGMLLGLKAFTVDELRSNTERFKGERGVVQLRELAPHLQLGGESPQEYILLLRWVDAGLPRPSLQIEIVDKGRVLYWLDMGLPDLRYAAEYDGAQWHGPERHEHDESRRTWIAENRHYVIDVFRKDDVHGPAETASFRLRVGYEKALRTLGTRSQRWICP